MTSWQRQIGVALATAVSWAVAWAPVAVLVGTTIVDPDNSMDEMWAAIGALPGFICGLLFSALVAIVERGRDAAEVPALRRAVYGALAGLAVGVLPAAIGGEPAPGSLDMLSVGVVGAFVVTSALSAVVTGAVRRRMRRAARRA